MAQWHKVRVEMLGDEMTMSLDDKPAGYLKSAGLEHPTKNAIGFTVRGKSVLIKSVKMWEATPSPDWPDRRAAFVAALSKK